MVMKLTPAWSTLAASLVLMQTALATPHTPRPGSPERRALMNTLRLQLGAKGKKAIITPARLNVENGWAYITGTFAYADGTRPGQDFMGGNFSALLRRERGTWRVKHRVYNGDVIEPEFMERFPQAPKAIFR